MEARPARQPSLNSGVLVRAVVVGDQVHVELLGNTGLNVTQETQKLLMPVPCFALGDHTAIGHVQGGKQGRRTMTHVVVRYPFSYPRPIGNTGCVRSSA
jgi:hypothetical protein